MAFPICSCGGMIKPDVVLYEEALDEMVIKQSISQIQQADLLIVGELLWRFILQQVLYNIFCGERLVMINRSATSLDIKSRFGITRKFRETYFLKYKKDVQKILLEHLFLFILHFRLEY